ncbi:MAG: VanZ family protein [Rubripirellula sp.]|nr:VanZ family protein [Rubripirellula sp.]
MLNDRQIRRTLAVLAIASLAGTIYASAIPLKLRPASLSEVWEQFLQTPWYWLGLGKRADWVANGLVLIPFGFFFAGALQWPKSSFHKKQLVLIGFAFLQLVIVCAIEAMQVWFPPRVRSINDMAAGFIGGMTGILLWQLCGQQIVQTAKNFPSLEKGFPRIALLVKIGAIALVLYGTMPFDVMFTPNEWGAKYAKERFNSVPMHDVLGPADFTKKFILGGWAFVLGVVLAQQTSRPKAIRQILVWCLLVELVSLPIYGRETSSTALLFSGIWGVLGVRLSDTVFITAHRLDRAYVWLGAAAAWSVTMYLSFVYRFKQVVTDTSVVMERVQGIWAVPFARAQRSTEFQALENITLKLTVFALLGFLLTGWLTRLQSFNRIVRIGVFAIWSLLLAFSIEISQAFLPPLVADSTDILLYTIGSLLGLAAYRVLMPSSKSSNTACHASPRWSANTDDQRNDQQ